MRNTPYRESANSHSMANFERNLYYLKYKLDLKAVVRYLRRVRTSERGKSETGTRQTEAKAVQK